MRQLTAAVTRFQQFPADLRVNASKLACALPKTLPTVAIIEFAKEASSIAAQLATIEYQASPALLDAERRCTEIEAKRQDLHVRTRLSMKALVPVPAPDPSLTAPAPATIWSSICDRRSCRTRQNKVSVGPLS
jgi:hypothetical protein